MESKFMKYTVFLRKISLIVAPNFIPFSFVIHILAHCKNNMVRKKYRNSLFQLEASQESRNYTSCFNRENLTQGIS